MPFPWVQSALLAALLALAPYAMTFPPSVRKFSYAEEPLYPRRVALVAFGLFAFMAAAVWSVRALHKHRPRWAETGPALSLTLACFVVGWRCFPYWVMGVYQVALGAFPYRDQDPKNLIPMTWIGDFWRLPILLFEWAVYLIAPCFLVAALVLVWRRRFVSATIILASSAVAAFYFIRSSDDYITWLLD